MKGHIERWNPSSGDIVSGTFKGYTGEPDEGIFCVIIDDNRLGLITIPLQDTLLLHQFRRLDPDINEIISIRCVIETSIIKEAGLCYVVEVHGICTTGHVDDVPGYVYR